MFIILVPSSVINFSHDHREAIQEDEKGSLQASVDDIISKAKKRKLLEKIKNVRLGMVSQFKYIEIYLLHKKNETSIKLLKYKTLEIYLYHSHVYDSIF